MRRGERTRRALIADDDPSVRFAVRGTDEDAPIAVEEAGDGIEALARLRPPPWCAKDCPLATLQNCGVLTNNSPREQVPARSIRPKGMHP